MAYGSIGANDGAVLNGTVDRELFQKKAATDVLKYFQSTNVARPLITNDSIESGKSKSFPIVGNAEASSRKEAVITDLGDKSINATEREIIIGDLTVAHSWLSDLDEAMAHYNSKAAQIESIGRALAKKVDQDIILKVIEAAGVVDAAAATTAGLRDFSTNGDDVFTAKSERDIVSVSGVATGEEVFLSMAAAMTEFRDKDAVGDPVFLLRPQHYFALLNNAQNSGVTWISDPHAQSGRVPMVLGSKVVYSPHFPAFVGTTGVTNCVGLLFAKECAGILELLSVNVRVDYIPQKLAYLMAGKMAVGYGILNHGSAITFGFVNP